jgi:polysaccharide export outer membrane protein
MKQLFQFLLCLATLVGATVAQPAAETAPPAGDDTYVLKSSDVVRLSVFEEDDLSARTRILQTGEAVFPLIGPVKIAGMSIRAATTTIRDLYAADYLVDPKVTLTVDEYAQQFVAVLGAVRSPGQIQMPSSGRFDIAAAIATAGGLTERADPSRISLVRANGATTEYSLAGIEKGSKVQLGSGDRIIVAESAYLNQTVIFVGEVRNRGPVPFPINGRLDLLGAIARAGGFTELANPRKVSVNRRGKVMVFDVREMSSRGAQPFLLEPDDIVTVPERLF